MSYQPNQYRLSLVSLSHAHSKALIEQAISFMSLTLSATLTNCLSTAQHPIEPCLLVSCLDPTHAPEEKWSGEPSKIFGLVCTFATSVTKKY